MSIWSDSNNTHRPKIQQEAFNLTYTRLFSSKWYCSWKFTDVDPSHPESYLKKRSYSEVVSCRFAHPISSMDSTCQIWRVSWPVLREIKWLRFQFQLNLKCNPKHYTIHFFGYHSRRHNQNSIKCPSRNSWEPKSYWSLKTKKITEDTKTQKLWKM